MSFFGSNPFPVIQKCNHILCLDCLNVPEYWHPFEPNEHSIYKCPIDGCLIETKMHL